MLNASCHAARGSQPAVSRTALGLHIVLQAGQYRGDSRRDGDKAPGDSDAGGDPVVGGYLFRATSGAGPSGELHDISSLHVKLDMLKLALRKTLR